MPIVAKDPVEAILDEADRLGMSVMLGVGMFAWFDFTEESLKWHENVAEELWNRYGHHDSFYAFYISEECAGNLFNSEQTDEMFVCNPLSQNSNQHMMVYVVKTALYISLNEPLCPRKIFLHIFECRMTAPVYTETVGIIRHISAAPGP